MDDFRKSMLRMLYGDKAVQNVEKGLCGICGSDKTKREDFQDTLSWKEFNQSGMCQECQDKVFNQD
jgi:hypothetical protein